MAKKVRVGINGFGRIGRLVYRVMASRPDEFEIVAINDLSKPEGLANLLKFDSVHGKFHGSVQAGKEKLIVNGQDLKVLSVRNPEELPWGDEGAEVVVESTGFFLAPSSDGKPGFDSHLKGGAKKVIISAPASDADLTVVLGVNDDRLTAKDKCISNASCTTNCLAPMAYILNKQFGIERGAMLTVHAYTNDQHVNDQIHKDPRRARGAAVNIIPTSTGAAKAIGLVIPELDGKLQGMAMRVPVPDGSITDLTVDLNKEVTIEDVNKAFKDAANGKLKGILEYSEDPLVSTDIIHNAHSCIFDSLSTIVCPKGKGHMVKVLGWYDNEWGYSSRTADLVKKVGEML